MKTFTIDWLNKCRCGNKSHTVKTARGNETGIRGLTRPGGVTLPQGDYMRLINRGSKQSPLARQACDIALAAHLQTYGDYGRSKMKETYTVKVEGVKVWVEVVNRKASYVSTAMTGMRRLRSLPGQVG